jgi:hypothetical protein
MNEEHGDIDAEVNADMARDRIEAIEDDREALLAALKRIRDLLDPEMLRVKIVFVREIAIRTIANSEKIK